MKYKRIWKGYDRFVVSEDLFLYEVAITQEGLPKRRLQPTFENRFWEVYALHRENGLYYAIIWKYRGERRFFKNALRFSRSGMFFRPIGRDLAVKVMDDICWCVLSYKDKNLVNITHQFLVFPRLVITSVEYVSPVVSMIQKCPQSGQVDIETYWKQMPKGYEQIEEKEVKSAISNCRGYPEDPMFV